MTAALLNAVWRFFSLSWVSGPIFEKELRVSSRRRRNYVLRFTYLALLTIFLAMFWYAQVPSGSSGLNHVSRMAEAGKNITSFIVWFQFIAAQIVAGIMLSTAISDEVYNRTLGLLMTTPINSFQIVTGKLFSKLLQIILLLAMSLPILAIVRVFGGVPWMYVISSLCLTLTAVIFVGSLSLFLSILCRRAYVVIIITLLSIGALFGLLPFLMGWLCHAITGNWPGQALTNAIFYANPYVAMMYNTMMLLEPRGGGGMPAPFWPIHCALLLAASAFILFLSVCVVRKVALRQATGQPSRSSSKPRSNKNSASASLEGSDFAVAHRRVIGPPVIWKELRAPMLGRRKLPVLIAIGVALIILLITYAFCADENVLGDEETHAVYVLIFGGLGLLFTSILPATCITSEKESRSWHLLLTTTLSDWQILFGKFAGLARRCLPAWSALFGHLIIFILAGYIHPIALLQMAILVAWIFVFLSGTGLYFSTRFKHTTTAVIANFALMAVIWALVPIMMALILEITRSSHDSFTAYIDTNPFVHAFNIIDGTVGTGGLSTYYWPGLGSHNAAQATAWMLTCMVGYMSVGMLFAWRAKCRLRRNIF